MMGRASAYAAAHRDARRRGCGLRAIYVPYGMRLLPITCVAIVGLLGLGSMSAACVSGTSEPDAAIMKIIGGWPQAFAPRRAEALGFVAESSFDDIIRIHIEDERGGDWVR